MQGCDRGRCIYNERGKCTTGLEGICAACHGGPGSVNYSRQRSVHGLHRIEDPPAPKPVEPKPTQDPTNPQHYKGEGPEVITLTRHMNFNRGNAVKYLCRAGKKNPEKEVEDLKKAKWYIEDELQRLTGEGDHAK